MFYGQWNPPVDQFLYENYFKNIRNGVAIECGAFDGVTESSCKFFEESMGWKTINIEPVPHLFEKLIINRPNSINIQSALSNKNGRATFTQAIHPEMGNHFGNGSLSHVNNHYNSLTLEGCKFEKHMVNTITYKTLIKSHKLTRINLFVLDVEGHEIQILNTLDKSDVLPDIFCIEHGHISNLNQIMNDLGYKFDKTSFNNSFYVKN